jgi:hypothetical protein
MLFRPHSYKCVGCSIYATPSIILRSAGSVGMAFVLWAIGASIAMVGTAVYVELGTVGLTLLRLMNQTDFLIRGYRAVVPKRIISSSYIGDQSSSLFARILYMRFLW